MRRRYRRYPRGRHTRWKAAIAVSLAVIVTITVWGDIRLKPLMQAYGVNHAQTVCSRAVYQSVEDVLSRQEPSYTDLVTTEIQEETGKIRALEANSMQINRLQADITNTILDRLEEQDVQTMTIPLGTLTGSSLLSGRGPLIPLKAGITATVVTDIHSEFTAAGINQTCHQLLLALEVQLFAALPDAPQTITIQSEFLIAETILAGTVPDLYAHWNRATG